MIDRIVFTPVETARTRPAACVRARLEFHGLIWALDLQREYRALATHVAVTSPLAVESLAEAHGNTPTQEALRISALQLRVVHELPGKLRWLECACMDAGIDPGVRAGLTAVLRSLTNVSELLPVIDSQAAVLLEPALLFHSLLSRLHPWLPAPWGASALALESDDVLEQLQLGIPDYLHPLLRQRFEALWQQFHQLRLRPVSLGRSTQEHASHRPMFE